MLFKLTLYAAASCLAACSCKNLHVIPGKKNPQVLQQRPVLVMVTAVTHFAYPRLWRNIVLRETCPQVCAYPGVTYQTN